ncbi:DUF3885 domain-containing protein [Sporosarcina sp. USHLN248]|uniref:DUF3885 domain-containing protein n=1 Tax=Sporosarcina sp. USHLN248 TaxID=3081300 RepID=UPI00301998C5
MNETLNDFLYKYFDNLLLKPPLFYSWHYSIRFEIAKPGSEHEDKQNMKQIQERSRTLFDTVFEDEDELLFVSNIHCEKANHFLQKRPANIYRKYVKDKNRRMQLTHSVLPSLIWDADEDDYDTMVTHQFVLACSKQGIAYADLLLAISHNDFAHPIRILKNNIKDGCDIFFVNVPKKMIYHLYDDRGCDIIAVNIEDLRELYEKYNDWILDYDRERIDLLFT